MKGRSIFWASLFLAFGSLAQADPQITFENAASVAFPTLSIPLGVRATGMGEAYTAVGDDVYALEWNPAGLADMQGYQLGVLDNEWDSALGIRQDFITYGQEIDDDSGIAGSVNYFSLGNLDERDINGTLLGEASAYVVSGELGYGWTLSKYRSLSLGVALEYSDENLYGTDLNEYGANVGLLYRLGEHVSVGVSGNHLGEASGGTEPPAQIAGGIAATLFSKSLTLAMDLDYPLASDSMADVGAEYKLGPLALRGGWREDISGTDDNVQSGFSAGAGFAVGPVRVDYSFTPYSGLNDVNRVQVTVALPRDFFTPKVVMSEGTSMTAQTFYVAGQSQERQGNALQALIEYQRCVESYPKSLIAHPQAFYLDSQKKVQDLQAELSKGGDQSQIKKLSLKALATADADVKAGHYADAISQLKQAKSIDPNNTALQTKLQQILDAREALGKGYRDAAEGAASQNDLAGAVENYRKLLGIIEDDPDAVSYLKEHRSDLLTLLQSIDRNGVYLYVAGNLEEAIKTWERGEALDYFGDVNFKRDLDKARRQLEMDNSGAGATK